MCPEPDVPVSPGVLAKIRAFGLRDDDQRAWVGSGRPDAEFDDWLTDRIARRPAGVRAREVYGADEVHDFARRAILEALRLGPRDRLLEVGCGGGLLRRVVQRDGRVAIYTTSAILRGTPAAPEPMASRGHFYTGDELRSLAIAAGLRTAAVDEDGGGQLLTARV